MASLIDNILNNSEMSADENILIGETIYIVGHNKPDVDAIISAQGYQAYRHSQGDFNYVAIRCDEINHVTEWIYRRWEAELPSLVPDVSGKKIVLVDHTDPEQRPNGWENADIIEVLDHHKIKLETTAPPKITIRPYGSTSTLVAQKIVRRNVKIDKQIAGLLLSAIIDDTLALRSPITTITDRQMVGHLAVIAEIPNLSAYAREQFNEKDKWHKMTDEEVITKDSKDFEMGGKKVRIAQIETMDNKKLEKRIPKLLSAMQKAVSKDGIDLSLALITDLIRNDCIMLVAGEGMMEHVERIFNATRTTDNTIYLPGVVSRKKQVVPFVQEYFEKL
ncbi:MAG: manganese-dependent inorganic pyrophosphatase [Candidatus Dojkabacteria bacterium]